jgi:adenylosuccinate lyase
MIARYQTPEMARLWSEESRYRMWALVEAYALEAWEALGEVPKGLSARLLGKLEKKPLDEAFARRVAELEATTRHDLVAFTRALTQWTEDEEVGRYLHLGLTSSDIVDTAQNALLVRALDLILEELKGVEEALKALALRYKHTPAIARTHGVHAEPTSFGLRFLSFLAAFQRDEERLGRAKGTIGVAMLSGSVGNYAHVPPEVEAHVAQRLGLRPEPLSTQVVPRDRHAEVLSALAILGGNLERVAVELRHLQRTEVREAEEPFGAAQKGSSAMPHKRNPVTAEQICGLARLVRSNLQAALENIALWHERDISHSSVERVILPDSTILTDYLLAKTIWLVRGMRVSAERMRRNLDSTHGLIFSGQLLLDLAAAGMLRETAYRIVQKHAMAAWEQDGDFRAAIENDPEIRALLTPERIAQSFSLERQLRHVDKIFARVFHDSEC